MTWRLIPAARKSPATDPSLTRRRLRPLPAVRRSAIIAASRNRQKRNLNGGESSTTRLTTTNEEPQTIVAAMRTPSAARRVARRSGGCGVPGVAVNQIAYYRRLVVEGLLRPRPFRALADRIAARRGSPDRSLQPPLR